MTRTQYGMPGVYRATPITLEDGEGAALGIDVNGNLVASISLGATIFDLANSDPLAVALVDASGDQITTLPVSLSSSNVGLVGRTTGGMTPFRSIDLDQTEEEVKATAGQVFSIIAMNTTDAPLYLKFYNATAANVTVGSTTPVLTLVVPGNANNDGAGFVWNNEIGFAFSTAITVACTTGIADTDTGAPGANACIVNIGYS